MAVNFESWRWIVVATMSSYRSELIDEIDRIKEVCIRLEADCKGIGMEKLEEACESVINQLKKAREKMKQAEF